MEIQKLVDLAEENIIIYGQEVISQRALSDYRDGLKPIHRRILWAMYKMGMHHSGGFKKSARVEGEVVGKYHPHGTEACYGSMVTMANLPTRLIHPEGNWGDAENPKSFAASRYTLCKLSEYADKYLLDPDYLAVIPYVKTYDSENEEPVYLPAKLPNLIVNGTEGIAVAVSCYIPSFTPESVKEIVKLGFKNTITAKDCTKILKFKFPYGGIIISEEDDILKFFEEGKGSLTFSPKVTIKGNEIFINEVPPRLRINPTKQNPSPGFLEKIALLKEVRKMEDLREGEKLEFKVVLSASLQNSERAAAIKEIRKIITVSLPFQTKVTIRKDNGEEVLFKSSTIPSILNNWCKWRIKIEVKVLERLKKIEEEKLDKNELMVLAIENREIIKISQDENDPITYLMGKLDIDETQCKFIYSKSLSSLHISEKQGYLNKIKESKKKIKDYNYFIENPVERIVGNL